MVVVEVEEAVVAAGLPKENVGVGLEAAPVPVLAPKRDCDGGWPAGVVEVLEKKFPPPAAAGLAGVVDPNRLLGWAD